jgi:hypothetical protein
LPIYSYAQQNAHFNSISNPRCPTKAFFARFVQLYQCIFRDMGKNNPDVGWKLYYETSTLESITLKEAIQKSMVSMVPLHLGEKIPKPNQWRMGFTKL